ncbi:MAG: response regulator transcription factor [Adhaeribacter sp.]
MRSTDSDQNNIAISLQQKIQNKISEIAAVADDLPGVIIIHDIRSLSVVYMSPRGTSTLGVSLEEVIALGPDYHKAFFNPEESQEYVPQIIEFLQRNNNDESLSLLQQVKGPHQANWTWYASTMKILLWNEAGEPILTITIAIPIDTKHHISAKVGRLLDENNFLRKHFHLFSQLSKREQQVLKLLALGKSATEIADALFIATATAETHRRNIRQKLNAESAYELSQYARAFNLI